MASASLEQNQHTETRFPIDQSQIEIMLVVITGVALAASLLTERVSSAAWLVTVFNLIAYAAGGYFGTIASLQSLKIIKPAEGVKKDGCCATPKADDKPQFNIDTLMILAAVGAALVNQWHEGAMLLFLFSLSNVLQDFAIGRSRQAIKSLMKLYPSEVKVMRDGRKLVVDVQDIQTGEIVLIEPGERIPVDGIVRKGYSAIDQSPITGESIPVDKATGDKVFAGTLNLQGALDVEATQQAKDTVLARIIEMVEEAQDSKAPTERFLEKFEQRYALLIIVSVALFIIIPPALNLVDFTSNFYRAMVIMTVAAPCALVISTPASFLSAIASAARGGVLFKGGAYIENLATLKAIAFDKTGTLTTGKPVVTDLISYPGVSDNELLRVAASAEDRSQHPVAKAMVRTAAERGLTLHPVSDFESVSGRGIQVQVDGKQVKIGSPAFMGEFPAALEAEHERLESEGKTVMGVQQDGAWLGLIAVMDSIRPTAKKLVSDLHQAGIKVVMLTGDNQKVARNIAAQTGVDVVYAELMPEDKARIIVEVQQKYGATGMVGDGVNDAPALAAAEIGIAMGAAGTDVALETADVVLMGDRLELIPFAIRLSQKARRVVWQNIAFSLAVIVILLISAFVINLPLPIGVLGHEGSTVIVVLNGLIQLLILPEIVRQRMSKKPV